jgi:hypothetical protein
MRIRVSHHRIGGGISIDGPGCGGGGGGGDATRNVGTTLGADDVAGTMADGAPPLAVGPGGVVPPLGPEVALTLGPGDSVVGAGLLCINVQTTSNATIAATAASAGPTNRRCLTGVMP